MYTPPARCKLYLSSHPATRSGPPVKWYKVSALALSCLPSTAHTLPTRTSHALTTGEPLSLPLVLALTLSRPILALRHPPCPPCILLSLSLSLPHARPNTTQLPLLPHVTSLPIDPSTRRRLPRKAKHPTEEIIRDSAPSLLHLAIPARGPVPALLLLLRRRKVIGQQVLD